MEKSLYTPLTTNLCTSSPFGMSIILHPYYVIVKSKFGMRQEKSGVVGMLKALMLNH